MALCVDVCVLERRGELHVCRVSGKMIVGRGERLVRVLKKSIRVIEVDSGGIMRQCMCTCVKRSVANL